jgi:hypothetical protein
MLATGLLGGSVPASAELPCGAVVSESITLTHDMECAGTAIEVATDAPITIDLGGHTVASHCDEGSALCATISTNSATVVNGRIVQRRPGGLAILPGPVRLENAVIDGGAVVNLSGTSTVVASTFVNGASVVCDDARVTVEDSDFVDGPAEGAAVSTVLCSATIRNNTFSGYGRAVHVATPFWSGGLFIEDNWIEGGGILVLGESGGTWLDGRRIGGNYVVSAPGDGIHYRTGAFGSVPTTLEISDNDVVGSGGRGIYVEADEERGDLIEIASNRVLRNAGLGIEVAGTGTVDGGGNVAGWNGDPLQCVG